MTTWQEGKGQASLLQGPSDGTGSVLARELPLPLGEEALDAAGAATLGLGKHKKNLDI